MADVFLLLSALPLDQPQTPTPRIQMEDGVFDDQ